eukprot:1147009-Pelagomonas_calceolata.AAC.5
MRCRALGRPKDEVEHRLQPVTMHCRALGRPEDKMEHRLQPVTMRRHATGSSEAPPLLQTTHSAH